MAPPQTTTTTLGAAASTGWPQSNAAIAFLQEAYARLTGRPVLLSLATVNNMADDYGRRFSAEKIRREFDLGFSPLEETLADEVMWARQRATRG